MSATLVLCADLSNAPLFKTSGVSRGPGVPTNVFRPVFAMAILTAEPTDVYELLHWNMKLGRYHYA